MTRVKKKNKQTKAYTTEKTSVEMKRVARLSIVYSKKEVQKSNGYVSCFRRQE